MIEETATVIDCVDSQARVEVQRRSTCQSCNAKSGCGTAVFSKTLGKKVSQFTVENSLDLSVGDKVLVGMHENAFLTGSVIVYLLPLITMMLFALLGEWSAVLLYGYSSEAHTIVFATIGFIVGLRVISIFSLRIKNDTRYQPIAIRKLNI